MASDAVRIKKKKIVRSTGPPRLGVVTKTAPAAEATGARPRGTMGQFRIRARSPGDAALARGGAPGALAGAARLGAPRRGRLLIVAGPQVGERRADVAPGVPRGADRAVGVTDGADDVRVDGVRVMAGAVHVVVGEGERPDPVRDEGRRGEIRGRVEPQLQVADDVGRTQRGDLAAGEVPVDPVAADQVESVLERREPAELVVEAVEH